MYYLAGIIFGDWINFFENLKIANLIIIKKKSQNKILNYLNNNDKIIQISYKDPVLFKNNKNLLFKNNQKNLRIMENKSQFAKYMMNKFEKFIPQTYYYHDDTISSKIYYKSNEKNINCTLIIKPNYSYGGKGIQILDNKKLRTPKNHVVSEYIYHNITIVGHFLIMNGKIIMKTYYHCHCDNSNYIKKGRIQNYKSFDEPKDFNDEIFYTIFDDLHYSGFACIDFTLNNENSPILFEINPRMGGSLIYNEYDLNRFLKKCMCLESY